MTPLSSSRGNGIEAARTRARTAAAPEFTVGAMASALSLIGVLTRLCEV